MTNPVTETQLRVALTPETRTRGLITAGVMAFVMLFCIGGLWLASSSISGAVIASGHVVVEGEPKEVQHIDGGIIAEIRVTDGQFVKKGDVVARLDETAAAANVDIFRSRLVEAIARKSRLDAEHQNLADISWPTARTLPTDVVLDANIKSSQSALFRARRQHNRDNRLQAQRKVMQFQSQIDGIAAQKGAHVTQLALHRDERAAMQKLHDQGHASPAALRELNKRIAFFQGEIGKAIADEAQARAAISETELAHQQDEREFSRLVLEALVSTSAEIREIRQQFQTAQKKLQRTLILAPSSGLVHNMSVTTVNGVVSAGSSLMQIVPQDKALKVEIAIEPHYIDEVRPGQTASLRLSAFGQAQATDLEGMVHTVSATTMADERVGKAYYKAIVSIDDEKALQNRGIALVPGMPVEVFLKTQDRSVLEYLVKPARDQINRAMREQ